jgi:hypothetical protein
LSRWPGSGSTPGRSDRCGFDYPDRVSHSVIHIDEIEPAGPGGAVRFVRRSLGVEAFGINRFDLPASSTGREHDESGTG